MNTSDTKTLSQQRFARFAQGYVTSATHAKGWELDRLVAVARPQPGWQVLDVATGGGHTALKFAPFVDRVIATDITPRMLLKARAFVADQGICNVAFGRADAEGLPYRQASLDLVTCRSAPHHFPDCPRFVQECARVLKPGGVLLVQDHVLPEDASTARYVDRFEQLRDPSHNRGYSESEWVAMFEASGLTIVHTEQVIRQHRFVSWVELQGCSGEVVEKLIQMIDQAPASVSEWLQPHLFDTPEATFVNRHIIIQGRKHV